MKNFISKFETFKILKLCYFEILLFRNIAILKFLKLGILKFLKIGIIKMFKLWKFVLEDCCNNLKKCPPLIVDTIKRLKENFEFWILWKIIARSSENEYFINYKNSSRRVMSFVSALEHDRHFKILLVNYDC